MFFYRFFILSYNKTIVYFLPLDGSVIKFKKKNEKKNQNWKHLLQHEYLLGFTNPRFLITCLAVSQLDFAPPPKKTNPF